MAFAQLGIIGFGGQIELEAAVWSFNAGRVRDRNISGTTFDLGLATLSAQLTKRRVP